MELFSSKVLLLCYHYTELEIRKQITGIPYFMSSGRWRWSNSAFFANSTGYQKSRITA